MNQSGMGCLDLWAIYPELLLAGLGIVLVALAGWLRGRWQRLPGMLAGAGLLGAMVLTARMLPWAPQAVFCDTYAIDGLATGFKLLLELGAFITLLFLMSYLNADRAHTPHSQAAHAPLALLFTTLGAIGLASALDLTLIVLFLQMMSLPAYLLVSLLRTDARANEATLKYFIYAAAALAVMAYGLTFLFGLTGSLELRAIGAGLRGANGLWVGVAVGIVLIGYGFEVTAVPFHFWAPDVYHGATAPVTGFISVVPKIAGFAALLRFLLLALPGGLLNWPLVMGLLALATMVVGNLVALRQSRLKRLLAYSSIAQAGYVLLAVAAAGLLPDGAPAVSAAGYYLAAYLFMNLGAFLVVAQVERGLGTDAIGALRGLGRTAPGPAVVLAISLLSLAGMPPLAGFAAKVLVLEATLAAGLTWLAVLAIANMVVGLYYYVAVLATLFLHPPPERARPLARGAGYTASAALTLLGTLLLGILPGIALPITALLGKLVS